MVGQFNNYHVNLVDGIKGQVPGWAFCLLLVLEIVLELLAAMYLADVIAGIVHLHLDYTQGDDEDLKQYCVNRMFNPRPTYALPAPPTRPLVDAEGEV
jgi:hypothetical protein